MQAFDRVPNKRTDDGSPDNCPNCGAGILGIETVGPGDHALVPCGCTPPVSLIQPDEDQNQSVVMTDGGRPDDVEWSDLTGFQRDLLFAIADLHTDGEEEPYGLEIRDHLVETEPYEIVDHGRLYPNLDILIDHGLIEKGTIDSRTNYYALTTAGRRLVEQRVNRRMGQLNRVPASTQRRQISVPDPSDLSTETAQDLADGDELTTAPSGVSLDDSLDLDDRLKGGETDE